MRVLPWLLLIASMQLAIGCGDGPGADAGLDVPTLDAPALDAPMSSDAPADARADVRPDASRPDSGPDARVDVPIDAGPDVSAEVMAALDLVCGVQSYANCTAPWACGCETFGEPPPFDVPGCERSDRFFCDSEQREQLTNFFRRVGVTVDRPALDECIMAARRSFDLCLPEPVLETNLVARCFDAFVLGAPIGAACDFSGMRCADGAGVCAGRTCTSAPDTAGMPCSGTCAGGLRCVGARCAAPVAVGGACSDHEDCTGLELCVGGRCGDPVSAGGMCTDDRVCETGRACAAGLCGGLTASRCVIGGADCGAGQECRSSFRRVCRPVLGPGEMCNGPEECGSAAECDFSFGFPGRCGPLPRAGEDCSGRCEMGLTCEFDPFSGRQTCQPLRRLGEPCSSFGREGICEAGLSCNRGTCGTPPRLDEPCSDDRRCESGLTCRFDPGTFTERCRAPLPEGADCSMDSAGCGEFAFCDFSVGRGVCAALPGEGQECPSGTCAPALECRFFAPLSRSICVVPGGVGAECTSLCAEGAFCGEDPAAGTCMALVCDFVGRRDGPFPEPVPFDR